MRWVLGSLWFPHTSVGFPAQTGSPGAPVRSGPRTSSTPSCRGTAWARRRRSRRTWGCTDRRGDGGPAVRTPSRPAGFLCESHTGFWSSLRRQGRSEDRRFSPQHVSRSPPERGVHKNPPTSHSERTWGAEEAVAVVTRPALAGKGALVVVAGGVLVASALPALVDVLGGGRGEGERGQAWVRLVLLRSGTRDVLRQQNQPAKAWRERKL